MNFESVFRNKLLGLKNITQYQSIISAPKIVLERFADIIYYSEICSIKFNSLENKIMATKVKDESNITDADIKVSEEILSTILSDGLIRRETIGAILRKYPSSTFYKNHYKNQYAKFNTTINIERN